MDRPELEGVRFLSFGRLITRGLLPVRGLDGGDIRAVLAATDLRRVPASVGWDKKSTGRIPTCVHFHITSGVHFILACADK
jgi:hypothetical protein